jgi:hypothetical protein
MFFDYISVEKIIYGLHFYKVNAGSNTVSLFSVDPSDPALLKMIGQPASSGGEFPMSLAINSAGTQACVLNGVAKNGVRSVSCSHNCKSILTYVSQLHEHRP